MSVEGIIRGRAPGRRTTGEIKMEPVLAKSQFLKMVMDTIEADSALNAAERESAADRVRTAVSHLVSDDAITTEMLKKAVGEVYDLDAGLKTVALEKVMSLVDNDLQIAGPDREKIQETLRKKLGPLVDDASIKVDDFRQRAESALEDEKRLRDL